jgi:hypothetical protein
MHLEQHSVDLSLFTFNWFLTVFVDNIPTETFLRIWDAYLYEGSKVRWLPASFSVGKMAASIIYCNNDGCHLT